MLQGGGKGPDEVAVAVIGSGFSGLGMAIRLKQAGVEDFVVLERADDVGGTWRDNTYPGCQCDVQSHLYSFSFAPNPDWSRAYSEQPEIWEYLRRCARDYGVMERIRFGHEVCSATWDEASERWRIETSRGPLSARVLVAGTGPLSEPALPDIPGLGTFQGTCFHSANWDHSHDLSGERVAVVGTGASAIQFVPRIQPLVERLHVFQRTPPWIMPHSDRPLTGLERRLYRALPPLRQVVRRAIYWRRETLVLFLRNYRRMGMAERIARRHLESQVPDPELRQRLTPSYTLGCKRILLSNDYYPAIQQPNAELVTEEIREVRPSSIVTADGVQRQVDTIIFGTGFHVTDMPAARYIRGRGGRLLDDVWQGSPRAYLGTVVAGFPNLFMLLGPNTGLGHTSVVVMAEAQIAYVMDCLRYMRGRGLTTVEVLPEAEAAFNERVAQAGQGTVWTAGGCKSWYLDRNGRNSTIWPDFTWRFERLTRRFDPAEYVLA